jgi:hypothetical protein
MQKVPDTASHKNPSRAVATNTSRSGIAIHAAHPTPLQRRIIQRVIATDDINTKDFVVLSSIGSYLEHYGTQPIVELKAAKVDNLSAGECVFIVAHGTAGNIAGYSAAQLYDLLVTKGKLPKHCPCIYLAACQSGNASASGQSIAAELSALLTKGGYNNTAVIGVQGVTAITDISTGVERGTNPKYDAKKEGQYEKELDKAAGGSINALIDKQGGKTIAEKAKFAFKNKDVQDFYTKLHKEPFFVPEGSSMQFNVPPLLQAFIDSFNQDLPHVVDAFMDMKNYRYNYFQFLISGKQTAGINVAKYGWSDLVDMRSNLKKIEDIVEDNAGLAAAQKWSRLDTIKLAIAGKITLSTKPAESKDETP